MENLILELHNKALVSAENYKKAQIELIDVLIELDSKRVYYKFDCNSLFEYCTRLLKLSESCSYRFIRIARTSIKVPELKKSLEKGEISTSKAVSLCSVLNPLNRSILETKNIAESKAIANQTLEDQVLENPTLKDQALKDRSVNEWLEIAKKSTSRELEAEVIVARPKDFSLVESKRTLSKEICSLHLKLPKDIMDKLDRAQDLLSKQGKTEASYTEVLDQLLDFYLERKDPLKKLRKNKVLGSNKVPLKNVGKKTNLEGDPQKHVRAKADLEEHLPSKVYVKANLGEYLQEVEFEESNLKNHPQNIVCTKTNQEEGLQKKVRGKTNPGDSLQKMSSHEMSLEKLRKDPLMKKHNETRLKNSLQKQALQKMSLQEMTLQKTVEHIPKKAGSTKTVPAKTRYRRAIPQKIKNQVFQKYKSCSYRKIDGTRCNQTRYLEIHHKIPVAKGGSDSPNNLVLLCSSCHRLYHQKEGHSKSSSINTMIRKQEPMNGREV